MKQQPSLGAKITTVKAQERLGETGSAFAFAAKGDKITPLIRAIDFMRGVDFANKPNAPALNYSEIGDTLKAAAAETFGVSGQQFANDINNYITAGVWAGKNVSQSVRDYLGASGEAMLADAYINGLEARARA